MPSRSARRDFIPFLYREFILGRGLCGITKDQLVSSLLDGAYENAQITGRRDGTSGIAPH